MISRIANRKPMPGADAKPPATEVPDRPADGLLRELKAEAAATASLTGRGALSPEVLRALAEVPRDRFVAPGDEGRAWVNAPLPIGHGQTISQPFVVALMSELLDVRPGQRILDVGTGSGYQAAILAHLGAEVFGVEVVPELARRAAARFEELGVAGVSLRSGDGSAGWPKHAPYDGILVACAAPEVPVALLDQLAPGGRLVAPVGAHRFEQELVLIEKAVDRTLRRRSVLPVAFVPMVEAPPEPRREQTRQR